MNEATLEARVHAEIQKHFPSISHLQITHQKNLTLKLGRNTDIEIKRLKQERITGRLDILISVDDKNLAILELKKPGEKLTDDDREQGLSYAKLLTPQAPLVIVSNGEESQFYQTYDGKEWNPSNKDEETVKALFEHSTTCAANERNEAIQHLLGKQPYIRSVLFKKYTESALINLNGKVDDFSRPLSNEFQIKRSVVSEVCNLLIQKEPLLVLVGPPLSGKTSVISQICRVDEFDDLIPIYIDASSTSYGVFQHIANQFTRELFIKVDTTDIRQWLFYNLQSIPGQLVVIIDGWTTDVSGTLKEDIDEIINFTQPEQSLSVLLSMNDTSYEEAKTNSGRPTSTAIGRNAKIIQINPLEDNEFELACNMFYDNYSAYFDHGASYNLDYRIPRLLRLLASSICSKTHLSKNDEQSIFIPSITSPLIFKSYKHYIADPKTEVTFRDLTKAYILDEENRSDDASLSIMSHGKGHIVYSTVEKELGEDKLNILISQGFIGVIRGPNDKILILPKVPEFLAVPATVEIAKDCLSMYKQQGLEKAYNVLIEESDIFPYGDVVGAKVLLEIAKKDSDLANKFIEKLLSDEPERSRVSEDSQALIYFEDIGEVKVHFGKGINESLTGNIHPWNILSQLSSFGCISLEPLLNIFATIGAYPQILIRPSSNSVKKPIGYHVHDIPDYGSVLCHKTGIVEVITYAMQIGFYNVPSEMLRLCRFAEKCNSFFLAYRLNMAAISTETCNNDKIANASKEAQKILRPITKKVIEDVHKQGHIKVGRNERCPCGSGKKYKKCCGK